MKKGGDTKNKSGAWLAKYRSLETRMKMKSELDEDFFVQENFELNALSKMKKAGK